ncbi:MAG: hypothetical protein PHV06_02480 [bacterium]|nr:hypothetical protein [bacterium]
MNLKRKITVLLILLTILTISAFGGDRGVPIYEGGKILGGTRTYGIDPCGAQVYVYTQYATSSGDLDRISIGEVCRNLENLPYPGFWVMNVGSHIEENIAHGDPLFLVVFHETDPGTEFRRSYYGFTSITHNGGLGSDPDFPEPYPDVTLYPMPIPTTYVSKENVVYVNWDAVVPQDPQVPFQIYYNVYRSNLPQELGERLNLEPLTTNSYIDTDPRLEEGVPYFYSIQLVTNQGITSGVWYPGPDGFPGKRGEDDDYNGIVDDAPEYGTYGSDDAFIDVASRPSIVTYINDRTPPEVPKNVSALPSDGAVYISWDAPEEPNDIAGYYIYREDVGLLATIEKTTIYSDSDNVKNGIEYGYRVRAFDSNDNISEYSNIAAAKPMALDLTDDPSYIHIFPEWSSDGKYVAFMEMIDIDKVNLLYTMSDGSSGYTNLTPDQNALFFSQFCWGPENKYIFYAGKDVRGDGTNQIFVVNVSNGATEKITEGKGNYYDPDWLMIGSDQFLICSIDGDLWIFDPTLGFANPGNLIELTNFNDDPIHNLPEDTYRAYQPKWSKGGAGITFVLRDPSPAESVAPTDIYYIPDAINVIKKIKSGEAFPIKDINDPRLLKMTYSPYYNHVVWCPSASPDGTMVSYSLDKNNRFNNFIFLQSPKEILGQCDFDAYKFEIGIGKFEMGDPPKTTLENEAFVKWAPSGGDKFVYTSYSAKNGSGLKVFLDPTVYGFDGSSPLKAVNARFEAGTFTLSDRSFTSISIDENYARTLGNISIWPLLQAPKSDNPILYPLGEYRTFLAGGISKELEQDAFIKMRYVQDALNGYDEKDIKICRYDYAHKRWILINSEVISDFDGNPENDDRDGGYVVAKVDKLGTFGLFIVDYKKQKASEERKEYRVYPNPFKSNTAGFGSTDTGIIFDRLPNDIEEINIYNISGDLVCTLESEYLEYWEVYPELTLPYGNTYSYAENGSVAVWKGTNEKGTRISSGVYIVLFKTESGKTESRKAAVIY